MPSISPKKFLKYTVTDPLKAPSLRFLKYLIFLCKIAGMMENYSYRITLIFITFWSEPEILYHYTKFQSMQSLPVSKIQNFHKVVAMIFFKQTDLPLLHRSHVVL